MTPNNLHSSKKCSSGSNSSWATQSHYGKRSRRHDECSPTACATQDTLSRIWTDLASEESDTDVPAICVFNWNILAPQFADVNRYHSCPIDVLHWHNRKQAIMKEIERYNPDIIALQEVDAETFVEYMRPRFEECGYACHFLAKDTLAAPGAPRCKEGVATCWKRSRFECFYVEEVHYAVDKRLDRPQVATLAFLQDRVIAKIKATPEDGMLVVANTHLLFNMKRGDIKLGQLLLLFEAIWLGVERCARRFPAYSQGYWALRQTPGILMCGDFNLTPNSSLYEWIRTGYLDFEATGGDCRILSGQKTLEDRSYLTNPKARGGRGSAPWYESPALRCNTNSSENVRNSTAFKHHRKKSLSDNPLSSTLPLISSVSLQKPQLWADVPVDDRVHWKVPQWLSDLLPKTFNHWFFRRSFVSWVENDPKSNSDPTLRDATSSPCGSSSGSEDLALALARAATEKGGRHSSRGTVVAGASSIMHTSLSAPTPSYPRPCSFPRAPSTTITARSELVELYHPFCYRSAYAVDPGRPPGGLHEPVRTMPPTEPAVTAYHGWQKGCIDYIWYSANELEVSAILELPLLQTIRYLGDIPHSNYPGSDHFNLVAEFRWKPREKRKIALLLREPLGSPGP